MENLTTPEEGNWWERNKSALVSMLIVGLLGVGIGYSLRYPGISIMLALWSLVGVGVVIWRAVLGNSLIRHRSAQMGKRVLTKLEKSEQAYAQAASRIEQNTEQGRELTRAMRELPKELRRLLADTAAKGEDV